MKIQTLLLALLLLYVNSFSFHNNDAPSIQGSGGTLGTKVTQINNKVSTVKDNVVEVRSQMKGLVQKIEELEELKKANSKTISSLEKHVTKMEDSMETTISKINSTLKTMANDVSKIKHNKDTKEPEKDTSKGASSCEEVKKCGNVDVDGEFLLYPSALKGHKVKMYCASMNTSSPKEFISLPNLNYGNYPKLCNLNCKRESSRRCQKQVYENAGYVEYQKIRLNIETMVVDPKDQTFTKGNGTRHIYGEASDCYNTIGDLPNPPDMSCGPKGEFVIDVTGTGFRFDKRTSWKKVGWKAFYDFSWSDDQKTILGVCGGYSGRCTPNTIYLEFLQDDKVPYEGAKEIQCA